MKVFIALSLFIQTTFAVDITTDWNEDFTKTVSISCELDETCETFFEESIVLEEEICEECFSTSMNMSFIFNGLGESITASNAEIATDEFFNYLSTANFISIKYDTPYDLIQSSSMIARKIKYKNLCEYASVDPILFFDRSEDNMMGSPRYIYCGDTVHALELFSIDLDLDFQNSFEGSQVF